MDDTVAEERPLVLAVDDDASILFLVRASLEHVGFRVEEASDGVAALMAFEQLHPDVVLLDVNMPGVDGFTVCAMIRAIPSGQHTPILMMTGLEDVDSINRAYEVGATDFITKPLPWTVLNYRIRYMLRASRMREALSLSEVRLAHAQRIARLGHWELDLRTCTMGWSTEAYSLFGITALENNASATLLSTIHPDDRAAVTAVWTAACTHQRPYNIDYRVVRSEAEERIVHERAEVFRDTMGRLIRMVGTVQDITERKRAEEAIRQHNEILEATVYQRTAELQQAKEAAEAASRAKSAFLANMSHELRTPLHGILGFARRGLKRASTALPEQLEAYFSQINHSGNALLTLLDSLLDLARLEAGRMPFTYAWADPHVLVTAVIREYESLALEKHLRLQYHPPSVSMQGYFDATRLMQVVRNLLSNAIKFSPEGKTVVVSLCYIQESMVLAIDDQGPGIPPEELEAIFDKFVQSSRTKTGAGGTGLGLAICREIVLAHGGRIWAENRPEGGTRLCLEVPLQDGSCRALVP